MRPSCLHATQTIVSEIALLAIVEGAFLIVIPLSWSLRC